jgi:hypothetical protein
MIKKINLAIFFFSLLTNQLISQTVTDSTTIKIHVDINNDKINDTVIHNKDSNIFIFKFKKNGKSLIREVSFFKNYGNGITKMDFSVKNNILIFKMSYAPRFLDNDTLRFEYDKLKDNWILKSVLIHRFSPIDPDLVASDCLITMKNKITITNSIYDDIEENITKTSKAYILTKKCKYKKGEYK